jgi:hypothetical protein
MAAHDLHTVARRADSSRLMQQRIFSVTWRGSSPGPPLTSLLLVHSLSSVLDVAP